MRTDHLKRIEKITGVQALFSSIHSATQQRAAVPHKHGLCHKV